VHLYLTGKLAGTLADEPLEMKQPQAAVASRPPGGGPHLGPAQPSAIAGGEAVCCLAFNLAQLLVYAKRRRQPIPVPGRT